MADPGEAAWAAGAGSLGADAVQAGAHARSGPGSQADAAAGPRAPAVPARAAPGGARAGDASTRLAARRVARGAAVRGSGHANKLLAALAAGLPGPPVALSRVSLRAPQSLQMVPEPCCNRPC